MAGAWTRKEGKNPEGGLNAKGRATDDATGDDAARQLQYAALMAQWQGFVEEVAALLRRGSLCAQARAACGYEELVQAIGDRTRPPRARDLDDAADIAVTKRNGLI